MKKSILLCVEQELSYANAPGSRMLMFYKYLKPHFFKMKLFGFKAEIVIVDENIVCIEKKTLFSRFKLVAKICLHLLNTNYNCIIVRGYFCGAYLCLFRMFTFKRFLILYDFHGYASHESNICKKYILSKIIYIHEIICEYLSDFIITQNKGRAHILKSKDRDNIIIIPNGIDEDYVINNSEINVVKSKDEVWIIAVGNWGPRNNLFPIIKALEFLPDIYKLIVIGSKCSQYKHYVNIHELNGKVLFLGNLSNEDTKTYLMNSNIAVVPYSENVLFSKIKGAWSSRKIFEYMAAQLPILITDVPGVESFMESNFNCLKYDYSSSQDITSKIIRLSFDTNLRNSIIENNNSLLPEYYWNNIICKSDLLNIINRSY